MRLGLMCALALLTALGSATAAEPAQNQPTQSQAIQKHASQKQVTPKRRSAVRHWHGYGFLPGYRTPEQIERQDSYLYWRRHPGYFWYGGPGFYRGRWNGGGFGPCWTQTPIGQVWNCGR